MARLLWSLVKRTAERVIHWIPMAEASGDALPCNEVRDLLLPAFAPCSGFRNTCRSMRWEPQEGHVPRGFCGAIGTIDEVQLVLVIAGPGTPHVGETYPREGQPEDVFALACQHAYRCFAKGKDPFHRNVRRILDSSSTVCDGRSL